MKLINSALSQLYRRHINVEARCCLIFSPLRIRKWKCAAEKRANSLALFALLRAEARPSLSFILSFKRRLCLIFGRRAHGSSEFPILSEMLCDLSVSIRKKRSRRRKKITYALGSGECATVCFQHKETDTNSDICCESSCIMTIKVC